MDALALRYGWSPSNVPLHCECGATFTVEHVLSCQRGGFPIIRHNEIRDLTATLLTEVCHNVLVEPDLQPLTGEVLARATSVRIVVARTQVDCEPSREWHYMGDSVSQRAWRQAVYKMWLLA